MQTKEQRRFWAEKRKAEQREAFKDQQSMKARKPVLFAKDMKEYDEIKRMHPGVSVVLDDTPKEQAQLFDTRELVDD